MLTGGSSGRWKIEMQKNQTTGYTGLYGKRGEFEIMNTCCKIKEAGIHRGDVCGNKAKVCVDGKYYCGHHDPLKAWKIKTLEPIVIPKDENQIAFEKARDEVIETCKLWYKGACSGKALSHDIREMLKMGDKL